MKKHERPQWCEEGGLLQHCSALDELNLTRFDYCLIRNNLNPNSQSVIEIEKHTNFKLKDVFSVIHNNQILLLIGHLVEPSVRIS